VAERAPAAKRTHVPTVLQMEVVECGAASLGMVLAHFGRWVPLEQLRERCAVGRDGVTALRVVTAARSYGLIAEGHRVEPSGLKDLPLPQILWWDMAHFVVLEGWDRDGWWVNDPGVGVRHVTSHEFESSFTGISLLARPGPDFKRGGHAPPPLAGLRRRIRGFGRLIALILFSGLMLSVPTIVAPLLVKATVDEVFVDGRLAFLLPATLGLLVALVAQFLLSRAQQMFVAELQVRSAIRMSTETMRHLLRLPMRFFTQRMPADVTNRASLNDDVAQMVSGPLVQSVISTILAVAYAAAAFLVDPLLGLVVVGAGIAQGATAWWGFMRVRRLMRQSLVQETEVAVAVATSIGMIETLKATGAEDDALDRYGAAQDRLVDVRQSQDLALNPIGVLPTLITSLALIALLGLGSWQVIEGRQSLGALVALQVLLAGFSAAAQQIAAAVSQAPQVTAAMERIDDILDYDEVAHPPDEGIEGDPLMGLVDIDDVTFRYDPAGPPVIADLSVKIEPGHTLALVGPSGCGKTTIARLITGLLPPDSGTIAFDGIPRERVSAESLTQGLAVVSQEIAIFPGTIADNITLWDPRITAEDVRAAADDACLTEEILARPDGFDTLLGEGGRGLSGGQRQRLALARALARRPRILLLDEATSALDARTEQKVMAAIARRRCTLILVAHRLSTIRDADEILVLDQGHVIERGTHAQLMAAHGEYADLVRSR
jgi:NHLM bacteriocin system ABC transporter peptidase/ATP-binding protein